MKTLTEYLPGRYCFTLTTLAVDGREMSQKTSPWAWISWESDPVAPWTALTSSISPASSQDSKYGGITERGARVLKSQAINNPSQTTHSGLHPVY